MASMKDANGICTLFKCVSPAIVIFWERRSQKITCPNHAAIRASKLEKLLMKCIHENIAVVGDKV
jgi:hypothetical protein